MQGKTIVVTGGLGALGSVVAETAAKRGASVALLDHAPTLPQGFAERLGANTLIIGGVDLTSLTCGRDGDGRDQGEIRPARRAPQYRRRLSMGDDRGRQGRRLGPDVRDESEDSAQRLQGRASLSCWRAAQAASSMSARGSALHAASGFGPYAASKSAVHRLTESLADELKLKGVTVNAVLPSIIDTPLNRRDMPKADFSRWVAPADLAAVILFLASDEAKAVTGALIPVSGGV